MSYEFTKLSDVPVVDEFPEGANAIIEANGEIRRVPSSNAESEWVNTNGTNLLSHLSDSVKHITEIERSAWNDKQDKLIAGENIAIAADGKTISATGGIQHDWNQNDATQPDYIKNRPFYTGDPVETMLVEESTVSFAEEGGGIYAAQLPSTFELTFGDTYIVYWDGVAYERSCADFDGMLCLGNPSIAGSGSDTGEPFLMVSEGERTMIGTADTSASHTISIRELATEIVKIDKKYLPFLPKPDGESYLTFSSPNSFRLAAREPKTWDGTLEYFTSDGTWTVWNGMSSLSAEPNGGGYVIYLRGTGNTVITGEVDFGWLLQGSDIACIGNIETLLDYVTVESGGHPVMADYCYYRMFDDCTSLTQIPELPATTLAQGCYGSMFASTSLTQAPELPATTLAPYCYSFMFANCHSLTQAPELPATTLAEGCYYGIFDDCTSLTQAPELPATTLANSCYQHMFSNCHSLTQAPELPATTLADYCYYGMFESCTSLTQIPELPATTLAQGCYMAMFRGCTSFKLSTTKTEEYTQEYRIPFSGNGTSASRALEDMFISTGGTFTGTPSINTTYYLSSDNMIVRGNEIANLNGYVKSMIDNAEYIIPSSTEGSTKKFKITVDDSGTITATEVT